MIINKKENYTLITMGEASFQDFYDSFIESKSALLKENIIIELSKKINISKKDFLLFLNEAQLKKENGTSFVIVDTSVNIDDLPENLNIVPTVLEAEDIIEMEAIERELGF